MSIYIQWNTVYKYRYAWKSAGSLFSLLGNRDLPGTVAQWLCRKGDTASVFPLKNICCDQKHRYWNWIRQSKTKATNLPKSWPLINHSEFERLFLKDWKPNKGPDTTRGGRNGNLVPHPRVSKHSIGGGTSDIRTTASRLSYNRIIVEKTMINDYSAFVIAFNTSEDDCSIFFMIMTHDSHDSQQIMTHDKFRVEEVSMLSNLHLILMSFPLKLFHDFNTSEKTKPEISREKHHFTIKIKEKFRLPGSKQGFFCRWKHRPSLPVSCVGVWAPDSHHMTSDKPLMRRLIRIFAMAPPDQKLQGVFLGCARNLGNNVRINGL